MALRALAAVLRRSVNCWSLLLLMTLRRLACCSHEAGPRPLFKTASGSVLDRPKRQKGVCVNDWTPLAKSQQGGKSRLYFALWLSKEGQGSCFCPGWRHDASRFSRIGAAFSQSGEFANSVGAKMGQFILHRSERRRVAAIC